MPSHHTRKRPRTGEARDRRTSPHTFLSKLDISETRDQRHVSFTGVTRRQQRRLERKQKRKRKPNSFRVQHDDSARAQTVNHAKSASLSEATVPEYADEEPPEAVNSVKKRKRDLQNSSENVGAPQANIRKDTSDSGRIPNRTPLTDSSPPPTEDPDAREIRRLERLLGMRSRKASTKSNDPYENLFDDTETDLLDLVKSCDDTLKRSSSSTRNINGSNESSTKYPSRYGDSNVDDLREHSSDLLLPASHDDIESESKRSQGGDPETSSNDSEGNAPYVAKWKKKGTRSSRNGSSVKELQGLLNRVSAGNAASIATRISQLYSTKGLSEEEKDKLLSSHVDFVLEAISQGNTVGSTNPYLRAHVKVLYKVGITVDIRVLARFTAATVKGLGSLLESESDSTLVENTARMSRIFGYIVAICAAYEIGVLSSGFICEAFSWIAGPFSKTRVDAELKLVQEVGPLLRKRDPAMFIDLVKFLHRRTKHHRSDQDSVAFSDEMSCKLRMLSDTVENIRNNRMKITKDAAHGTEESNVYLPFQASLTQLLEDEFTKRKWWDNTQQNISVKSKQSAGKDRKTNGNLDGENPRISRLADALRLHTDSRRGLLGAIVGSVNCSDAFHRIEQLGVLTSRQKQKDLTYILTQCCGAEQPYNNFYALLAQRVCKRSREARFALDYTIQDAIKGSCYESSGNLSRKGANIARYLGDLWASEDLPLAMLRRIPDLEDVEEGERNFYIAALQRMISQRVVTRTDPVAPFTKLKREFEAEDNLFCTSLSVFLMRHGQSKMPKQLQPVLSKVIDGLETADQARNETD